MAQSGDLLQLRKKRKETVNQLWRGKEQGEVMSSNAKYTHMLYNPKVEIAVLKWKPLFVGLNSPKITFYASIHFSNFHLLSFSQKFRKQE